MEPGGVCGPDRREGLGFVSRGSDKGSKLLAADKVGRSRPDPWENGEEVVGGTWSREQGLERPAEAPPERVGRVHRSAQTAGNVGAARSQHQTRSRCSSEDGRGARRAGIGLRRGRWRFLWLSRGRRHSSRGFWAPQRALPSRGTSVMQGTFPAWRAHCLPAARCTLGCACALQRMQLRAGHQGSGPSSYPLIRPPHTQDGCLSSPALVLK